MYFAWKKENSRVQGGTGAFFKSQRPVKHLEKQKQYSCWPKKQNQIRGDAHRDARHSQSPMFVFNAVANWVSASQRLRCPWLSVQASKRSCSDVWESWFLHRTWDPWQVVPYYDMVNKLSEFKNVKESFPFTHLKDRPPNQDFHLQEIFLAICLLSTLTLHLLFSPNQYPSPLFR